MKIPRPGVLVRVTVMKPLPAGRQAFRLGSGGYVNSLRRRTLPNPVLSRRSSFESLRTNGESKGTIRASFDKLRTNGFSPIMVSLSNHAVTVRRDILMPHARKVPLPALRLRQAGCRGRNDPYGSPPSQIRACGITALGSCLRSERTAVWLDRDDRYEDKATSVLPIGSSVPR